jgi:hypothetical protein
VDKDVRVAAAEQLVAGQTVVYACCDMLSACELTSDLERAAQWCAVADRLTERLWRPVPLRLVPHLLR